MELDFGFESFGDMDCILQMEEKISAREMVMKKDFICHSDGEQKF